MLNHQKSASITPSPPLSWKIVNDNVMGGLSSASLNNTQNMLTFTGQLSSANNGGFSSIQSPIEPNILDSGTLSITVKGDSRRYQLRLKTGDYRDGKAYKVEFINSSNQWLHLSFKQEDFIATYRGKILKDETPLKFSEINQIGFLIADKQWQEFTLNVRDICFE